MPTLYDAAYWETLRANRGDVPKRVTQSRFWEMLEVLPPADWTRDGDVECFRVIEAQTDDLYTWMVAIRRPNAKAAEYWEMIAPRSMRHDIRGLIARIETARRLES